VEETVEDAVKKTLLEILDDSFNLEKELESVDTPVICLIGINGSGKTTTAAKLAHYLDKGVVLGAGDTFRAASIEQLKEHGEALDVKVIAHEYESDPAAVGYDTVEHAEKNGKIAIVDTAGRSHADRNLMNQLEKMVRVNKPDISFLVVDALAGNDVLEQVRAYEDMFDAVIVTKMDVDENGGAVISVSQESGKPIAFLGTGQGYKDLEEFDKERFVEEILGQKRIL
jgi:fused signal recognition particle receptor